MTRRSSTTLAVLAVGAVLAVALVGLLVLADVGLANSGTRTDSTVTTAASNGSAVDLSGPVYVLVLGDAPADADLAADLVAELRARGVDAAVAPDRRAVYDRPVLVVATAEYALEWGLPRSEATARWALLYAQSGNLTQFGESTYGAGDFDETRLAARLVALADDDGSGEGAGDAIPVVTDDASPVVLTGSFSTVDATTGLVSLPWYDRTIRAVLVDATVDALA